MKFLETQARSGYLHFGTRAKTCHAISLGSEENCDVGDIGLLIFRGGSRRRQRRRKKDVNYSQHLAILFYLSLFASLILFIYTTKIEYRFSVGR